mgnify:CR=1 FL=1
MLVGRALREIVVKTQAEHKNCGGTFAIHVTIVVKAMHGLRGRAYISI